MKKIAVCLNGWLVSWLTDWLMVGWMWAFAGYIHSDGVRRKNRKYRNEKLFIWWTKSFSAFFLLSSLILWGNYYARLINICFYDQDSYLYFLLKFCILLLLLYSSSSSMLKYFPYSYLHTDSKTDFFRSKFWRIPMKLISSHLID